jgi:hypothetical protein
VGKRLAAEASVALRTRGEREVLVVEVPWGCAPSRSWCRRTPQGRYGSLTADEGTHTPLAQARPASHHGTRSRQGPAAAPRGAQVPRSSLNEQPSSGPQDLITQPLSGPHVTPASENQVRPLTGQSPVALGLRQVESPQNSPALHGAEGPHEVPAAPGAVHTPSTHVCPCEQ